MHGPTFQVRVPASQSNAGVGLRGVSPRIQESLTDRRKFPPYVGEPRINSFNNQTDDLELAKLFLTAICDPNLFQVQV
jgi:hypothetical protein